MTPPSPRPFGKYTLERELARGGMARVWLATLRGAGGFEKHLVVKQIRDELAHDSRFIARFVEEAKTSVALSHPNIVPVYELGVETGTYYLAMELVLGLSVADLMRAGRDASGKKAVLTPEEGAYVGVEVCRALDYAHRRMNVVHRDITPRNVMIDDEGQVKVIDFGIAAPSRVAGHEVFGSPGHMPPEQARGALLGPPTDLFALAVLLVEAWSGAPPFRRATPEESTEAMNAPHPRASDTNARLVPVDDLLARCMRLDMRERPQSADEVGRALRGFLSGVDVGDVARGLGERVRKAREALAREASEPAAPSLRSPRRTLPSGELVTKTFAARDEVERWSAPPPAPAADAGPATRPLPETGAGAGAGVSGAGAGAGAGIAAAGIAAAGALEGVPASVPTETVATRPLETSAPAAAAGARPFGRRAALVASVGSAVALAAWLAQRGGGDEPSSLAAGGSGAADPSRAPSGATEAGTPGAVTGEVRAAPAASEPAPGAPPSPAGRLPPSHDPAPAHAPPSGSETAPTSAGRAQVLLLGDPGTRVLVDGTARGACPVRLALEPGAHDVRFLFDPTGESRGERVTVRAGEKVTVRADFLGATPTVRVQR